MIRKAVVIAAVALTVWVRAQNSEEPKRIYLFDGTDTSKWTHRDGKPVQWKVADGELEVTGGGDIVSKEKFEDFVLHVEFMSPKLPEDVKGQDRGNSGVYVQGRYEIQVLDSYGLEAGMGDCGAIYGIKAPSRNVCKPPGEWQSYDIIFRAARFDDSGTKTENARMTVTHNGVRIHDDVEIPNHTPGGLGEESAEPGPILLQDHGNPVRYRDVWVRPLTADGYEKKSKGPATTQAALPARKFDDLEPGLIGEYFREVKSLDELPKTGKPFLVRTDKQVQFDRAHGEFYGSKLNNNFAVRWSGVLRVTEPGTYTLGLYSDDRSRLFVNDELLIENTKPGKDDAEKIVPLEAGDYPIRIEYHQGGGSGHFHFGWKPPGVEDWRDIPEAQLLHLPSQADIEWDKATWEASAWDRKAWLRDWAPKFAKMDYGPFISHTIKVDENQTVNKGIMIKLGGEEEEAAVLFDTELLRYAAGWTGGFLKLEGVVFNESHGTNPSIEGQLVFITQPQCGWSGSSDFTDPRPNGLGNLPRQRGHFKGLYRNGERVVLSYLVGARSVLETPSFERRDGRSVFRRTIEAGPGDREILLNLGDAKPLRVAPSGKSTKLIVTYSEGPSVSVETGDSILSPSELCKGGPARWPQTIATKGTLGTGEGPYVVDTIGIPEDNPWHAWMRFGGLDFFADGRAALCTWSGDVWIVSGIDDKLENVTWKRFASGMFQPLGLKIVDDQIYVLGRDQITRLHDLNDDGEADFYENFNNDCIVSSSFHEFALDLQTDLEGNFYFAKGGPVRPGGRGWQQITDHNGCVLRVLKDGSKLDVFATGVRAPNGMGSSPSGIISVSDNEGTWTPACRVSFVKEGSFLGVVDLAHQESRPSTYEPPICWLPHETVDNSSGGQGWVTSEKWGPLANRMLHMSYGQCALFLVLLDEVDGVAQGGVVKFADLDFDTGMCRARFHPIDGQLYVTGLRGWQTRGVKDGALQRVRYTGKPVHMPCDLKIGPGTITIGFTCTLDPELAADPDSYAIEQWNYVWSSDYGSPEVTVDDPMKKGHDPVEIESISLSADHRSVILKLPSLRPVMQMKVQMKLESKEGEPVEHEIYHTINRVPGYIAPSTQPAVAGKTVASP